MMDYYKGNIIILACIIYLYQKHQSFRQNNQSNRNFNENKFKIIEKLKSVI